MLRFIEDRETGRHCLNIHNSSRKLYKSITPDSVIFNVELPQIISGLVKWSICGRYLYAFSKTFQSILAFKLVMDAFEEEGDNNNNANNNSKQQDYFFNSFFKLCWESKLGMSHGESSFIKDFVISTAKFLVFATSCPSTKNQNDNNNNDNDNDNDSSNIVGELEDYRFIFMDPNTGSILSECFIKADQIILHQQMGFAIYGTNMISLNLLYRQEIWIYKIIDNKMVFYRKIGESLFPEDSSTLSSMKSSERNFDDNNNNNNNNNGNNNSNDLDGNNLFLNEITIGFKQRFLAFLFKKIKSTKQYYENLKYFLDLSIWKAQFINSSSMIIKLGPKLNLTLRYFDNHQNNCSLIVVYDFLKTEILDIWRSSNKSLLTNDLIMDYSDYLCHPSDHCCCWLSNPSNNCFFRESLTLQKNSSRYNHIMAIPYNGQQWNPHPSPYLDEALFRFDDRLIYSGQQARQINDISIKFFCRDTSKLCFQLVPSSINTRSIRDGASGGFSNIDRTRKFIMWMFHPFLPLILCQQQTILRTTVINIYYRKTQ